MTNMDGILLSKKTSIALKGILCIFVLLHHLLRVDNAFIDSILNLLGPLAVGGFFLLSGYGLIVNYKQYGLDYVKKILFKKIPILYLIIIITNMFYLALYASTVSSELSIENIITSVLYLSFFNSFIPLNSWIYFIADLIIYYLVFAIVFGLIGLVNKVKNKAKTGAIIHFIFVLVIFVLISCIFQEPLAQRAIFCFSLGVFAGAFEDSISSFCVKYRLLFVAVLCVLLTLLFMWVNFELVEEQILPLIFCLLLMVSFNQIDFQNKVVLFVGKISLYIYLSHGFFFKLFNSIYTFSSVQSLFLVSTCSILLSAGIYLIKTKIKKNLA